MIRAIPLTQGEVALIDNRDIKIASRMHWVLDKRDNGICYASSIDTSKGKPYKKVYLHQLILGLRKGHVIDHINGNGLDCRRKNIRHCSQSENMSKAQRIKKPMSGYRGVYSKRNKWFVTLNHMCKTIHVGTFESKEKAAHAYNKVAKYLHGKFAIVNKIRGK